MKVGKCTWLWGLKTQGEVSAWAMRTETVLLEVGRVAGRVDKDCPDSRWLRLSGRTDRNASNRPMAHDVARSGS